MPNSTELSISRNGLSAATTRFTLLYVLAKNGVWRVGTSLYGWQKVSNLPTAENEARSVLVKNNRVYLRTVKGAVLEADTAMGAYTNVAAPAWPVKMPKGQTIPLWNKPYGIGALCDRKTSCA